MYRRNLLRCEYGKFDVNFGRIKHRNRIFNWNYRSGYDYLAFNRSIHRQFEKGEKGIDRKAYLCLLS